MGSLYRIVRGIGTWHISAAGLLMASGASWAGSVPYKTLYGQQMGGLALLVQMVRYFRTDNRRTASAHRMWMHKHGKERPPVHTLLKASRYSG